MPISIIQEFLVYERKLYVLYLFEETFDNYIVSGFEISSHGIRRLRYTGYWLSTRYGKVESVLHRICNWVIYLSESKA